MKYISKVWKTEATSSSFQSIGLRWDQIIKVHAVVWILLRNNQRKRPQGRRETKEQIFKIGWQHTIAQKCFISNEGTHWESTLQVFNAQITKFYKNQGQGDCFCNSLDANPVCSTWKYMRWECTKFTLHFLHLNYQGHTSQDTLKHTKKFWEHSRHPNSLKEIHPK